jgi:hypothetical protein
MGVNHIQGVAKILGQTARVILHANKGSHSIEHMSGSEWFSGLNEIRQSTVNSLNI